MENYSFSSLYVAKLPLKALYALNKSTIELSKPIINQLGPIAAAGLTYLETINNSMILSLNNSKKSARTTGIQGLDTGRDNDINEIKRETSAALKSSNVEKKLAASILQLFLAPFWDIVDLPQDIETGIVDDMVTKYNARPDLITASKLIGIDGLFVSLAAKNAGFDLEFKSRNAEYSERLDSASSFKSAAEFAYIQYCTALEQTLNFTPNDTVLALFNQLNELRKKYRSQEGGKDTTDTTSNKE